jgi:hypothetical protein
VTDQRDQPIVLRDDSVAKAARAAATQAVTRRALLRGAAIAAPTILTLSSASAAIALSSVKTFTSGTTAQPDGNYYCLAEESTLGYPDGAAGAVEPRSLQVGDSPEPTAYQIPEREYLSAASDPLTAKTEYEMCRDGGNYYYESGGAWPGVEVKPGILMSANSYGSLGIAILPVTDI